MIREYYGEKAAAKVATILIDNSTPFRVTPMPCNVFEIEFENEQASRLPIENVGRDALTESEDTDVPTLNCKYCGREHEDDGSLFEGDPCPSDDCPSHELAPLDLDGLIALMKQQIMTDIKQGVVARTVSSFSELHDFVDANCYGHLCDDAVADAYIEKFGGRDADEGMPDGFLRLTNSAQDAVDAWLRDPKTRVELGLITLS